MTEQHPRTPASRLRAALESTASSTRLRAALTAGTSPQPDYVDVLVERSAVEPDFFVRDMLTWALTRHDPVSAVDRLLPELRSPVAQARSQALHTLSKIGDRRAWPSLSSELLRDDDPEVARAAWRAAAGLVPDGEREALARELASQFGRGDRELQRSLSRAFAMLDDAGAAVVAEYTHHADPAVRAHAIATARLIDDPDDDFAAAVEEAQRIVALQASPTPVED
ncbi:HEAT repeat domain-containing protein [Microbacterium paraoxydans]|uniref:HEAT repeat domain-containing protein n=1 Tax=Microbacterium paraoxydans TaxID=199592 RepID=A0ABS5IN44_9MICO|nr:HEAT repeat domain-containing protein [Microbacterium paraoxydans]MBS0024382.1 HEAT repeat domain-containing protein [Microbacterium paraoxydans]